MTLTLGNAPLGTTSPDEANYTIDGPRHRLLMTPFPRRVRGVFSDSTVFDSRHAMLLHESNILPALYVPVADIDSTVLVPTDTTTHCPFKGDASYWSLRVGDRTVDDAVWGYDDPLDAAPWLAGMRAFYWDRLDHWYDETEEVFGHLRDPYHRVDVRQSDAHVVVRVGDAVVADSTAPMVLSETGLPNRWYLPHGDIRADLLVESATTTHCPYKGQSTYWSLADSDAPVDPIVDRITDVAWSYGEPFDGCRRIAGHLSFDPDHDAVTVDASAS